MSRYQKDPLRPLTAEEGQELTRLSRSLSAPAAHVERARALLAIADGASYTAAAHQVGRRHNETISAWVSRFNREGLAAVRPGHGGASRRVMAAARRTGHPAARIHPRRHHQDPDPVPSRIRPSAAAPSTPLHQCGAASLAARAPERDLGGAARSEGRAGPRRDASRVDGVAGGPDHALPPPS